MVKNSSHFVGNFLVLGSCAVVEVGLFFPLEVHIPFAPSVLVQGSFYCVEYLVVPCSPSVLVQGTLAPSVL